MRFEADKVVLEKGLEIAMLAVSNKPKDGLVTTLVRFSRGPSTETEAVQLFYLTSTDNILLTRVPIGVSSAQGSGDFAVEAKRLQAWLGNVDDGVVSLEITDEGLEVSCGRAEGVFQVFDADLFPSFEVFEGLEDGAVLEDHPGLVLTGPVEPFTQGLSFVRVAIGTETSNNERANQYQISKFSAGQFFASDTHVIALYNLGEQPGVTYGPVTGLKMSKAEVPKVLRFLSLSSVDTFTCIKTATQYVIMGDDGSLLAFAVPSFELASIPDLSPKILETEVWSVEPEDIKGALGALDAMRAAQDCQLTLEFPAGVLEEPAEVVFSVQDVRGKSTCTVRVPMSCQATERKTPVHLTVHVDWLRMAISKFSRGGLSLGLSLGRTKYIKLHQLNEVGDSYHDQTMLVGLRSVV